MFVSPVKILMTFVFAYLLLPNEVKNEFSNVQIRNNFTSPADFGRVKASHWHHYKVYYFKIKKFQNFSIFQITLIQLCYVHNYFKIV